MENETLMKMDGYDICKSGTWIHTQGRPKVELLINQTGGRDKGDDAEIVMLLLHINDKLVGEADKLGFKKSRVETDGMALDQLKPGQSYMVVHGDCSDWIHAHMLVSRLSPDSPISEVYYTDKERREKVFLAINVLDFERNLGAARGMKVKEG